MPLDPQHWNDLHPYGIKPYSLEAVHTGGEVTPRPVEAIILHHTAGSNSVLYGVDNDRGVSYHMLITPNTNGPYFYYVYQYMDLLNGVAFHAGPGSIEGIPGNPNNWSIGIEIEGPPFPFPLLLVAARVVAAVLTLCVDNGHDPRILLHKDIQDDKSDPAFPINPFLKLVYSNFPLRKQMRVG